MIRNIVWKGLNPDSMEFCRIHFRDTILVKSTIVGCSEDIPYKADYEMELSLDWVINCVQIKSWLGNSEQSLTLKHNGHGKWHGNDREWKHLEGCMDIDISLTPFTNSIPVNRLRVLPNASADTELIYIDVLRFGVTRQRQSYTNLGAHQYHFRAEDGHFEAKITMDELNLVSDYPGLFNRLLVRD
ncbi:MAG: hypothetical protein EOP49_32405 [Sphingobacteriales bacterium]|nr:MAG: hypothetical protein EOP49_32405 [Sphingobacteriales bacterium]